MSKFIITACGLALVAFTSCSGPSSPSSSAQMKANSNSHSNANSDNGSNGTTNTNSDISFTVHNSCCDEDIAITGNVHISVSADHNHFHLNFSDLEGVGSNGNIYHGGASENMNGNNDGADNQMFTENFGMTSPGGCKFSVKIHEHITFDQDGNIQVENSFSDVECME